MRRLILLLALLVAVGGCSRGVSPTARPQIGFLLSSMEKERYHKDRAGFGRRVEQLGGQMVFESAGGDAEQQVRLGSELVGRGLAVLVVQSVNSEAGRSVARLARSRGIPVVAYDRLPEDAPFDWYVTHDSEAVGRLQAEAAVKALGGRGTVAIFKGAEGNPVAETITRGALKVLEGQPGIRVVAVQPHAHWLPAEARASAQALLDQHPELAAILCNNSALARGVVEELAARPPGHKIFVAGADADLTNCQWIAQGRQDLEVLKGIEPLASAAAEVAMALARGQDPAKTEAAMGAGVRVVRDGPVPALVLPVLAVDRTNLEQVVVTSGFHPREALFPRRASPDPGAVQP